MSSPRLLDLFCGAGGAAVGYHRAGFDVVGVDHVNQPRYPFEFVQDDALEYLHWLIAGSGGPYWLEDFQAIHASPPCQAYTQLAKGDHPRLIEPVRDLLVASGLPYVIENVVGAPLRQPTLLCGSMFGLNVRRHRLFETNFDVMAAKCQHGWTDEIRAYYGKKGWLVWTPAAANVQKRGRKPLLRGSVEQAPADMGIDWMETWDELREAIPPALHRTHRPSVARPCVAAGGGVRAPEHETSMTRYREAFSWTGTIDGFLRELVTETPLLHVCSGRSAWGDVTLDLHEPADVAGYWTRLPFNRDEFGAVFADPPWDSGHKSEVAMFVREALRVAPVAYLMAPWLYCAAWAQITAVWFREFPGVHTPVLVSRYERSRQMVLA